MTIEELQAENERLKQELADLKKIAKEFEIESLELSYLEGGGVDNWCGYDESMEGFREYLENDFESVFDD